ANPQFGHFSNDPRLSDAETQLIDAWVDNGCPEGDPKDRPPRRNWTDGWQIPPPQQVVYMAEPFTVPAEGVVDYQNFVVDPCWTEDKWIQAAEVRPGNRAVVHHIIATALPPGTKLRGRRSSEDGEAPAANGAPRSATAATPVDDGELRSIKLTAYVPG